MKLSEKIGVKLSLVAAAALLSACGGGGGGTGGNNLASIDQQLSDVLTAQSVLSGAAFSLVIPNVSQGTLTYTATLADGSPLPSGLIFDAVSRTFSGAANLNLSNDLTVKVTASNGVSTTTGTFTLSSVPQGVFRTDSGFLGVVFPKAAGKAEMWTLEESVAGLQLWYGDVDYPGEGFAALSQQRAFAASTSTYSASNGIRAQATKLGSVMRFTVNSNSYDTVRMADAWPADAAVSASLSDWQGPWEAVGSQTWQGQTVNVKHAWAVNSDSGQITGGKYVGDVKICDVVGDDSKVTFTNTPVTRIKVTYSCVDSSTGVYSGIGFNRSNGSVNFKNIILPRTDASSAEFLRLAFTRSLLPS